LFETTILSCLQQAGIFYQIFLQNSRMQNEKPNKIQNSNLKVQNFSPKNTFLPLTLILSPQLHLLPSGEREG
jgi:hypothetical protein